MSATLAAPAFAQLSKVDTLLQQDGYQLQGALYGGGLLYYNGHTVNGQYVPGFAQANYTAPSWAGSASFTDANGMALNGPWAIWNVNNGDLPDQVSADVPHLNNLVSMAIGDEIEWVRDPSTTAPLIAEFQQVNSDSNYNNTIVYTNNSAGQLTDNGPAVTSFIQQAHPDMLTFDTYPFQTGNATALTDSQILNVGYTSWYTELRFYRDVTLDNSYQSSNPTYAVDWGLYRQTYATDDGTRTPSASEYGLQTFSAMAFGAKYLSDFITDGSASQLYTDSNQDAITPFYSAVQHVNQEASYFGRTMVYLQSMAAGSNPDPEWYDQTGTPDILFMRGQTTAGQSGTLNTLPNGFTPNGGSSTAAYSSWTSAYVGSTQMSQPWTNPNVNDPWMTGFGQIHIGGGVAVATGDAMISWFRPLGETKQQVMDPTSPQYGDIYMMVVNALSTPTGSPSDCLQNIHMDFTSWPLAPGLTQPEIQYVDPATGQIMLLTISTTLDGTVTNASNYPAGTYLLTKTSGNGTGKLRLSLFLNGGEAFLFKFYTGDAFLAPEPGTLSLLGIGALGLLRRRRR
jgi:PEP-CTERM motif